MGYVWLTIGVNPLYVDTGIRIESAADLCGRCLCIADIHSRGKLPFIVGGTGLYVDSLLNNVSFSDDKRDEEYCLELRKM